MANARRWPAIAGDERLWGVMAVVMLLGGFALLITGLALWSVPLALVVAGTLLFISGGLEIRNERTFITPRKDEGHHE